MIFENQDNGEKDKSKKKSNKDFKKNSKNTSKTKPRDRKGKNLLDFIPVRDCKWTRQKDRPELVRLLKPRFDTKLGERIGKKMKLKKTFNINLDEYGTAVWRLCDGKLTVREVGEALKIQFGEEIEPLYQRLAGFLVLLEGQESIIFKPKPKAKKIKRI
jgi:hypothetical protein